MMRRRRSESDEDNDDEEEVRTVTVSTAIPSSNVGYRLLKKMGWKENTCLGLKDDDIIEPIHFDYKDNAMGLGQRELINSFLDPSLIAQRRSELLETETTPEDIELMLKNQEQEDQIKEAIQEANRPLYCELCHKQYANAQQIEAHRDSYDHNHKKRLKEMQDAEKARLKKNAEKSKKQELDHDQLLISQQQQALSAAFQLQQQKQSTPVVDPSGSSTEVKPRQPITFGLNAKSSSSSGTAKKISFSIVLPKK